MPVGRITLLRVMRKLELANEHKRQLRVETVRLAVKAEARTNIPAESAMEVAQDIMGRIGEGVQFEVDKLMSELGVPLLVDLPTPTQMLDAFARATTVVPFQMAS